MAFVGFTNGKREEEDAALSLIYFRNITGNSFAS